MELKTQEERTFAVLGKPIQHSLSPQIYQAFGAQYHHFFQYQKMEADEQNFLKILTNLRDSNFYAINLTSPLKNLAYQYATLVDKSARLAKAANMLLFLNSCECKAYNTDGLGLVLALENIAKFEIDQKNILIIGAGGAVQGVLPELWAKHPKQITILNRSLARAFDLQQQWPQLTLHTLSHDQKTSGFSTPFYDLIIHATPARSSLDFTFIPENIIHPNTLIYDMAYYPTPTAFIQWAKEKGATQLYDGLSMLVAQAAYNYQIWYGVWPKWEAVYEDLNFRNSL